MTLQTTGSISFQDIINEFGEISSTGDDIGSYRVRQTVGEMTNLPLDEGIPQGTSSISFADFYGKKLNIIISYSSSTNRPPSGRNKWNNNTDLTVIGGYKTRNDLSSSAGTSVTLHVSGNTIIGNQRGEETNQNSRYLSALRTGGAWNTGTQLEINIGGEAQVCGGGGNGGDGATDPGENGGEGKHGNSAIGIAYFVSKITVQSGGVIAAGAGGGAGGGAGKENSETTNRRASGGGGGGGAGVPAGLGGDSAKHGTQSNISSEGNPGENGERLNGGDGGNGGSQQQEAIGGGGGGGGCFSAEQYEREGVVGAGGERGAPQGSGSNEADDGSAGTLSGTGGSGGKGGASESNSEYSSGGNGGNKGYAVVRRQGISAPSITNNGLIIGSTTEVTEATNTLL